MAKCGLHIILSADFFKPAKTHIDYFNSLDPPKFLNFLNSQELMNFLEFLHFQEFLYSQEFMNFQELPNFWQ